MTELVIKDNKVLDSIPAESELRKETTNIINAIEGTYKNLYSIAAAMARIESEQLYLIAGFESTVDYADKVFKLKKTAVYNFIKIGAEYTNIQALESNLPHPAIDFSTSQITEMLPLKSRDKVVELIEGGEISPVMTVKEIREVVKANQPKKETKEAEETTEAENTPKFEKEEIVIVPLRPEAIIKSNVINCLNNLRNNPAIDFTDDEFIKIVRSAVNTFAKELRDKPIDTLFAGE